ncbi:MAG TPA: hypothetical protein VHN18_12025 [Micromonosporaceae bacterium]|nr:hypothetical protein [Micromonosporaceae bacterium]
MQDENRDGRIDERDAVPTRGQPVTASQPNDSTMYRSGGAHEAPAGALAAERAAAHRPDDAETQRFTTDRPVESGTAGYQPPTMAGAVAHRETMPEHRPDDEVTVVAGPRPRASLLATLGLIFGVAAVLLVLTGTLAGYGIALGAVGLLLSFGGMSATGRRHVAGKSDAMLGLLLGLGAIGLGILAVTGQFGWPNTDADTVQRFREWLDAQTVDRF